MGTGIAKLLSILGILAVVKLLTAAALGLQLLGAMGGPAVAEAATKPKPKAKAAAPQAKEAEQPKPPEVEPAPEAPKPPALAIPEQSPRQADGQALRQKEEDLARREQALQELERDLDGRLKKLTEMETNIKRMLDAADARKDDRVKHLVDVYSNMKAKQAAAALEQLQQPIAVKILSSMPGRQAGEIMSNMATDKAAVLSEALTRNQIPFAN